MKKKTKFKHFFVENWFETEKNTQTEMKNTFFFIDFNCIGGQPGCGGARRARPPARSYRSAAPAPGSAARAGSRRWNAPRRSAWGAACRIVCALPCVPPLGCAPIMRPIGIGARPRTLAYTADRGRDHRERRT